MNYYSPDPLVLKFATESNIIEGIHYIGRHREHAQILETFLHLTEVTVTDLERFVFDVGGRPLRERAGMNVRIGDHVPPPGGPAVRAELERILANLRVETDPQHSAYLVHHAYESLHPFMDGNGRSGRALWAWMMTRVPGHPSEVNLSPLRLRFLHQWYYQSLQYGSREFR